MSKGNTIIPANIVATTPLDKPLDKAVFAKVLPSKLRVNLTDDMINEVNAVLVNPELRENYRDNILSFTSVLTEGRHTIKAYLAAVKFVSFKLLGSTNLEAYIKTFPERMKRLIDENASDSSINSFTGAYNRTQLVQKIFAQTLTPNHVLNADLYQKALNRQAYLMVHANSEKVQTDAANSLLTQLKMPETQKVELDINVKEDKSIDELRRATLALAAQQRQMLEAGAMTPQQIAHSTIVIEHVNSDD